jgi:ribosomal protein S18 acetylase RimI-like enzyme
MVRLVVHHLRLRGIGSVHLLVVDSNGAARNLYLSAGFQVIGNSMPGEILEMKKSL